MSRSNVKVASELRQDEARLTRKRILKCSGSVRKQDVVAQHLANSGDVYLEKLNKLKKFTKNKKEIKKKLSQLTEWVQGGYYLVNYAQRIEEELQSLYQKLMVSMLQERVTSFTEVSDLMDENMESRKQNQSYVMLQLHEIKNMLNNIKKHYKSHQQDQSEEAENKKQSIASVVANLIVQMRNSHNSVWDALCTEEKSLNQQIKESIRNFSNMQSEYRKFSEESKLDEELEMLESDDEQIITLLEDWKQRIYELEDQHAQNLEKISTEKNALNQEYGLDYGVLDETIGGWDEKSHQVFVKVIKRAHVQGLSRSRISSTLAAELPNKSPKEISRHENWYNSMMSLNDKKKKLIQNYTTMREEMLSKASQSVSQLREKVATENLAREELERHEKARMLMHERLHEMRAERAQEMESKLVEIERLRQQAAEESRLLEEKQKAEKDRKKLLVEKFKRDREEILAAQKLKRESDMRAAEEEKKRQILEAKPMIEHREALLREKEFERKQKQAKLLEEEARRLDILNRLAEQVPYWDALQNASSKLDHITASAESHRYFKPEEASRGFQSLNGFTDKKVFKDARFRLALALREAGVQHSSAAKAIVQSMNPRVQAPW